MKRTRRHNNKRRFAFAFPIITIVGISIISLCTSGYEKAWFFDWNGINVVVKDSISAYKYNSISSGVGGNGRDLSYEVKKRIWIMTHASQDELIKLTDFPSGNIKAIAYEGLIRKRSFNKKTEYILKAIRDTTDLVYYQVGCIGTAMSLNKYVSHYVLNIAEGYPPFPPESRLSMELSEIDKEKIISESRKYPLFEH